MASPEANNTPILSLAGYNGIPGESNSDEEKGGKRRNYKLTADPLLKSGPEKLYRYDGQDPSVRMHGS